VATDRRAWEAFGVAQKVSRKSMTAPSLIAQLNWAKYAISSSIEKQYLLRHPPINYGDEEQC
jgi:hypothetical protein